MTKRPDRQLEPYEINAYAIGRQMASQSTRRTHIERREVHLPSGEVLVEETVYIEES